MFDIERFDFFPNQQTFDFDLHHVLLNSTLVLVTRFVALSLLKSIFALAKNVEVISPCERALITLIQPDQQFNQCLISS